MKSDNAGSPTRGRAGKSRLSLAHWIVLLLVPYSSLTMTRKGKPLACSSSKTSTIESALVFNQMNPTSAPAPAAVDEYWCPEAQCQNSAFCQPCQRRLLIIITMGRSASTTLTWMLDRLPGLRMAGENNNVIQNLINLHDAIMKAPFKAARREQQKRLTAWGHNPIPKQSLACVSQKMVETIVPPLVKDGIPVNPKEAEEIVGFKTIRLLLDNRMKDVPKIAAFLKTHFPCTRYIINRRSNLTEQAQSQKNHFFSVESMNLQAVTDKLEQETQRLLRLAELLGTERATILDSSEWQKTSKC